MSKTVYTMAEIKGIIENLKYQAVSEFDKNIRGKFESEIETNPELKADLSVFENCIEKAENLLKKYTDPKRNYYSPIDGGKLRSRVETMFQDKHQDEKDKIWKQFNVISDKLKVMRNPDKAIEFLKLCGIELTEGAKESEPEIPVDPEFIKSVLPKAKMLQESNV